MQWFPTAQPVQFYLDTLTHMHYAGLSLLHVHKQLIFVRHYYELSAVCIHLPVFVPLL